MGFAEAVANWSEKRKERLSKFKDIEELFKATPSGVNPRTKCICGEALYNHVCPGHAKFFKEER